MTDEEQLEKLCDSLSQALCEELKERMVVRPRTYGFEYELQSKSILTPNDLNRLREFLLGHGYANEKDRLISESGMYITFEPGGQIEFCSPPILPENKHGFSKLLKQIDDTNRAIGKELGIEYLPLPYVSGKGDAALLLENSRYRNMHERMARTGTRGREMMKGTASIHLHVHIGVLEKMFRIYIAATEMALGDEFGMGSDRRDIWKHTDPQRSGMMIEDYRGLSSSHELVRKMVDFAMRAEDLYQNLPFYRLEGFSIEEFLIHMTTLFTEVRLNLKGPTIELRTLDSMPLGRFSDKWYGFLSKMESI